jgi:preprotein translocase SecE subunit
MSRALRRHPLSTKQAKRAALRPGSRPRRPGREGARQGRGLLGLLRPRWAEDIVGELRKVTWPSMEDTRSLTIVVVVVAAAVGLFLGGVDMFFNWFIDSTLFR